MESLYRTWVEISLERLVGNFNAIRQLVGPTVETVPVVKADAYRHGAEEVARTLQQAGARWLAVSNAEEGVRLREAGVTTRILVMADFLPEAREAMARRHLTPVLHDAEDIREWDALARRMAQPLAFHLKLDTGMGRLGTRAAAADLLATLQACPAAQLEGLMTHFASAADYRSDQTERQTHGFWSMQQQFAAAGIQPRYQHLSSTIPVAYGRREAWGNMVRPGHALYGYVSPAQGNAPPVQLQVQPVLSWRARVLAVKPVPTGAEIGYGAMYRAPKPMRYAVLAAGYADGVPHRLSNRGYLLLHGRRVPVLGAVSMDLTTVDVTDCPEAQVGDAATLLGQDGQDSIDAQEMARWAGTISYSVLCGIGLRVKRVYRPTL